MQETQNKARVAAHNNANLCAAIMAANGIRTERDEIAYRCIDKPLPYYPKLVTLAPVATDELNARCKGVSGIKDSFSCLDVDALGLRVAFNASWIWCDAQQRDMPDKWVRIEHAEVLLDWHRAWRGDDAPTELEIFPFACLENPELAFFARLSSTQVEAGCVANLSNEAIGISNVFSSISNDKQLYEEALAAVGTVDNERPVVGYEHGADLDAACRAGFEPIGPLRVLIR